MLARTIIFLVLNFAALAIGSIFTSKGVASDWYTSLDQAPWTPPGWVFGFAWTTIMICFSVYMAQLWSTVEHKQGLVASFSLQWILNIIWNPIFFHFQMTGLGLVVIFVLTILIGYFMFNYWGNLKKTSLLILPYFLWLIIATSLNAFIVLKN